LITNNNLWYKKTVKQFWSFNKKKRFWFSKSWDCLEIEIDQRVWDRISVCIDFRFISVTSVILVSVEQVSSVCLLRSVVGQEKCVSWGDQGHFLGCVVSDLG